MGFRSSTYYLGVVGYWDRASVGRITETSSVNFSFAAIAQLFEVVAEAKGIHCEVEVVDLVQKGAVAVNTGTLSMCIIGRTSI